jgi:hypothetical protein
MNPGPVFFLALLLRLYPLLPSLFVACAHEDGASACTRSALTLAFQHAHKLAHEHAPTLNNVNRIWIRDPRYCKASAGVLPVL